MSKQVKGVSLKDRSMCKKNFWRKDMWMHRSGTIAEEADTTTGSILSSRLRWKRRLFSAIVEPVAREFTEKFACRRDSMRQTRDKQAKQGEVLPI